MDPADLEGPERLLWAAFGRAAHVDLRSGNAADDDLAAAAGWGPERTIRAEVIVALMLGAVPAEPGHGAGIRLRGARVVGRLDLSGVAFTHVMEFDECCFDDGVVMVETAARTVRIRTSRLGLFEGGRMRVEGLFDLSGSAIGLLRLEFARLDSQARLVRARIGTELTELAVAADGLVVNGRFDCGEVVVRGGFELRGAQVNGPLRLRGASFAADVRFGALACNNLVVEGQVNGVEMVVAGGLRLDNARVRMMTLNGARLTNANDAALGGGGLVVEGGFFCGRGFTAQGEVRLVGAKLGANLALDGARLGNPGGLALNLDRATLADLTAGELEVRGGCVSLLGTQIGARLDLTGARIEGRSDKRALFIENATVGSLHLDRLRAQGSVTVRTSRIEGRVHLTDAEIRHAGEVALRFSRTEVGADVFAHGLTVEGTAKFTDARIGRHLNFDKVRLVAPDGVALDLRGLTAGMVSLRPAEAVRGTVVFTRARLGVLRDDPAQWPDDLKLGGLTYEALEPRLPPRERLRWVTRDRDGFQSQTYEQLAAHYTAMGQHADAREVLHAKERHQRTTETFLGRVWSLLQDHTTGYGYQPWRAALWLVLLLTVGTVVYGMSPPRPLKPGEAPHFNPLGYTFDLLLPIVDLGQERAFNPAGAHQWFSYVLVAAGWVLATTIAAGAARVISRR